MLTPKVIPIKSISSWSFSRYNAYKICPAQAKYKFIDKLKEPGSVAMERGAAIHKLAEDYVKGKLRKLPEELSSFSAEFKHLRSQSAKYIEESWAWMQDWTPTSTMDWNGAWLRVKLDAAYINTEHNVLVVIDHKTGKYSDYKRAEYEEQLQLYGLAGLKQFPTVGAVSPRLWYLDHGVIHPNPEKEELEYRRADEAYLDKLWRAKVKPMLTDTKWAPTPSERACKYCHFRKENGGPCKY